MKHSSQLIDFFNENFEKSLKSLKFRPLEVTAYKSPSAALAEPAKLKLLDYGELLIEWSKRVDLIAPASIETVIEKHLIDSLLGGALLDLSTVVVDVGSGAGLPGIPLAIAYPETKFVLCEPRAKRVAFLQEMKRRLGLSNVSVVNARVEELTFPSSRCSAILRAVASTPEQLAAIELAATRSGVDALAVSFMLGPESCPLDAIGGRNLVAASYELFPSNSQRRVLRFC